MLWLKDFTTLSHRVQNMVVDQIQNFSFSFWIFINCNWLKICIYVCILILCNYIYMYIVLFMFNSAYNWYIFIQFYSCVSGTYKQIYNKYDLLKKFLNTRSIWKCILPIWRYFLGSFYFRNIDDYETLLVANSDFINIMKC